MSPEKFDLKAWLTGFALGLAGKPLTFVRSGTRTDTRKPST